MIIKKIKLQNFRSHKEYIFNFSKQTTVIVGENGCGKTSILEGIFEGCQGKSFKAVDKEIVRRGEEFYRVELEFSDGEKVKVFYDKKNNKKNFFIQNKKTGRIPRQNKYPIILFQPSDLNLVEASPTSRRNYFDRSFSQLFEQYNNSLLKYNRALKQRNELLKEEFLREDALFSWNIMLAKYGTEIFKIRSLVINEINEKITEIYRGIAENKDEVFIKYETEVIDENNFFQELEKRFQRDYLLGHTSFGIHHDDYRFFFNQVDASGAASRGEIRSMILALKFVEAQQLVEKKEKKPIILLDDVFSELDEKRQKCLVKNFKNNQVIITSVNAT